MRGKGWFGCGKSGPPGWGLLISPEAIEVMALLWVVCT